MATKERQMKSANEIHAQFTVRPHRAVSERVLGPLQTRIMEIMWAAPDMTATVGSVQKALNAGRGSGEGGEWAYTTVMTTLRRMAAGNLLSVNTKDTSYVYSAVFTEAAWRQYVIEQTIRSLFEAGYLPYMSYGFLDQFEPARPQPELEPVGAGA